MRWQLWLPLLLLLALAVILGGSLNGREAAGAAREKAPVAVLTAPAELGDQPVIVAASGHVTPLRQVEVRPQVTAVVARVLVREGQMVRAGQALFQLDDAAERAGLLRARAQLSKDRSQLALAERNLARSRELVERGYLSPSALDNAQGSVDAARGAAEVSAGAWHESEAQLAYRSIRAAIAGRVGAIPVSPGSLVQPAMAQPLTTVTQLAPIAATFSIPEQLVGQIRAAARTGELAVQAALPAQPGHTVDGRLVFVDSAVNSASGQIQLKAEFANDSLYLWPGNYVNLSLHAGQRLGVVSIPVGGLVTGPESKFVYLVDGERRALRREVELLDLVGERAVVSGLAGGESVVVEGTANLRPGDRVATPDAGGPAAPRAKRGGGKA
jgi:RND family efflux transporter MFP subunit